MAVNHALKESIALNSIDVHKDDGACGNLVANMASIKLVDRVPDGFELAIKIGTKMVYWSELPPDILQLLLEKTETHRDLINFILVSKMWYSVAKEIFFPFPIPHKLPLVQFFPKNNPLPMLLQSYTEDPHSNTYSLYCLANNRTCGSFYAPELTNKWLVGSMGGWLGTVDTKNLQMNLINPFTHKQMTLPPVYTIPNPINDDSFGYNDIFWFVNKVVMFSDPEKDPDDCIVVALVSNARAIAYCKIKDKKWKRIEQTGVNGVVDIIKHNNMLYAVTYGADLYVIDFTCNIKVTLVAQFCKYPYPGIQGYLMDSSGDLLLLLRHAMGMAVTHKFEIFKLKEVPSYTGYNYILEERRYHDYEGLRYQWSEVKSIGDKTVFVGRNGTMWFDSNIYPGCKANCIYFADDTVESDMSRMNNKWYKNQPVGNDVGIYHTEDDRIEILAGFSSCPLA